MITCTCGHNVDSVNDIWNCILPEYDRMGERCLSYVSYCKECYDDADKLMTEEEENNWLNHSETNNN